MLDPEYLKGFRAGFAEGAKAQRAATLRLIAERPLVHDPANKQGQGRAISPTYSELARGALRSMLEAAPGVLCPKLPE